MTREETVKNLLTELIDMIDNGSQRDLDRADEIGASIIKLFEQKSVIDKVRAEIEAARYIDKDTKLCKNANASGLEVAMQIIDKYRKEQEDNGFFEIMDDESDGEVYEKIKEIIEKVKEQE